MLKEPIYIGMLVKECPKENLVKWDKVLHNYKNNMKVNLMFSINLIIKTNINKKIKKIKK